MPIVNAKHRQLYIAVTASIAAGVAHAQEPSNSNQDITAPAIEEVLILGRLQSSAQAILDERLDQPFAADLLSSEQFSRTGDSNIAAALMRVTGVTLVDDQYVYVRSLGERYSNTQLNGAAVPSPELTRNVLPLDILPSSIVDSLKIQKAWSPDLPANFGGGNIDIRTKSVPDELLFNLGLSTGKNSESSGGGLFFAGHQSGGLPQEIRAALNQYAGGDLSVPQIQNKAHVSLAQARQINRELALSLDRNIEIQEKSHPLDYGLNLDLGNAWDIGSDFTLGAMLSFSRDDESRNKDQREQGVGNPDAVYSQTRRSVDEIRELGSFNAGIRYQDDHEIALNSYLIRNTEEEALIKTGHDSNYEARSGDQYVEFGTQREERELRVLQAIGTHVFDQLSGDVLRDIKVEWFTSESKASTDVPHQAQVQGANRINPSTGEVLSTTLLSSTFMASFAYLELEDEVRSRGFDVHIPLSLGKSEVTLSGGYSYNDKAREYYGYTANINAVGVSGEVLSGTPGQVLTDAKLGNLNNSFDFSMGTGLGKESYIAGEITDAAYGMLDLTWDYTWRLTAGARYENFRRALLPLDLLNYSYVDDLVDDIEENPTAAAIKSDDWYPSLALTYMNEGFMNAENFQVRLSASQTVVRPDLREKADIPFFNEDNIRVYGNPALKDADLTHYDLRTEWFFSSGNNATVSLFYKDIENPIEQSRMPGSDDQIVLDFYNALSGEIYGVEFEGLRELGAGFFLTGNVTLSKSEIVSPTGQGFTSEKRSMTGHSEEVVNLQLGYDSDDGLHSASLVYNVFGERVYYAARLNGHEDAFEQPFHSLNLVYSYYPTSNLTAKVKVSNILGEKRTFEQVNNSGETATILERDVGTSFSLDLTYSY